MHCLFAKFCSWIPFHHLHHMEKQVRNQRIMGLVTVRIVEKKIWFKWSHWSCLDFVFSLVSSTTKCLIVSSWELCFAPSLDKKHGWMFRTEQANFQVLLVRISDLEPSQIFCVVSNKEAHKHKMFRLFLRNKFALEARKSWHLLQR